MSHPLVNLYQMRIQYQFSGLSHAFQTWLDPDAYTTVATGDISDYTLQTPTTTINAQTWLTAFYVEFVKFFANTTSVVEASLWAYDAGGLDAVFLGSASSVLVGTNVNPNILAAQTISTARTSTGRIKKFSFEEGTSAAAAPSAWASLGTGPFFTFGNFVLSDTGGAMVARDGSRAVSLLRVSPGQNEATFRRRYRPS